MIEWADLLAELARSRREAPPLSAGRGVAVLTFRHAQDGVSHAVARHVEMLRGRAGRGAEPYSRVVTVTGGPTPIHRVSDRDYVIDGLGVRNDACPELVADPPPDLAERVLAEAHRLADELGGVLDVEDVGRLVVHAVNTLPHNVCAAMAVVLAAERRGIGVLNVCHNGYWEHELGARAVLLAARSDRDVFAVVRAVCPWRSPRWRHATPTAAHATELTGSERTGPSGTAVLPNAVAGALWEIGEADRDGRRAVDALVRTLPPVTPTAYGWAGPARLVHPTPAGSTGTPFVVLCPVRITHGKRLDRAVRAVHGLLRDPVVARSLLAAGRRPILVCAGAPDERMPGRAHLEAIRDAFRALHEDPAVLGPLRESAELLLPFGLPHARPGSCGPARTTVRDLYAAADVVLVTGERESFGLPVVEAAASGTPVLCVPYTDRHRAVYAEVVAGLAVAELPVDPDPSGHWVRDVRAWAVDPSLRRAVGAHNRRVASVRFGECRVAADLDRALADIATHASPAPEDRRAPRLAAAIAARAVPGRGLVVGLGGATRTGKSTLAAATAALLADRLRIAVLGTDDFWVGPDGMRPPPPPLTPADVCVGWLLDALDALTTGRPAVVPRFRHGAGLLSWELVEPADVVIVEGIFALHGDGAGSDGGRYAALRARTDLSVGIRADADRLLEAALSSDLRRGPASQALTAHALRERQHRDHVEPTLGLAALVLPGPATGIGRQAGVARRTL